MPCGVHVMGRNGGQDEQRTPSFAKTEMKASVGCSYLSGGCVVLMKRSFYAGVRGGAGLGADTNGDTDRFVLFDSRDARRGTERRVRVPGACAVQ